MKNSNQLKPIPQFLSEEQERLFWATHDSTDYIDWSKAEEAQFPNLKPSTRSVTLRLPESLLYSLKVLANKKDVPYQSLMKIFLSERIKQENESFSSSDPMLMNDSRERKYK